MTSSRKSENSACSSSVSFCIGQEKAAVRIPCLPQTFLPPCTESPQGCKPSLSENPPIIAWQIFSWSRARPPSTASSSHCTLTVFSAGAIFGYPDRRPGHITPVHSWLPHHITLQKQAVSSEKSPTFSVMATKAFSRLLSKNGMAFVPLLIVSKMLFNKNTDVWKHYENIKLFYRNNDLFR